MQNRPLLLWIALYAILALATNGLLAVHLWACCDHAADSGDSSSPAPHSPHQSQHCRICQILLIHSGKYIACLTPPVPWTGPDEKQSLLPCKAGYSQITHSPSIPRGPPA